MTFPIFTLKRGGVNECVYYRRQRGISTGVAFSSPQSVPAVLSPRPTQPHRLHPTGSAGRVDRSSRGETHLGYNHLQISVDTRHCYKKYPSLTKSQTVIFISVNGISKRGIKLTLHTALPVPKHKVFLLKIGEITRFTEESWQLPFSWPD